MVKKVKKDSWPWRYCFADSHGGRLTPKQWSAVIIGFALLYLILLQVARLLGFFQLGPNPDHIHGMWQIIKQGHSESMHVPPGFAYYLAFKWQLTYKLGLPYWSARYFIDIIFVVSSGVLSVLLGQALTRNRFLAIASGFILLCAPIFILAIALEEAAVFFLPFFLSGLLLFVRELQRRQGPRAGIFLLSGALIGISTMIRGNPQFIFIVLGPFAFWLLRKADIPRWRSRAFIIVSFFLCAQILVMLPWSTVQRKAGLDGITAYPSIYRAYFWSVRRETGNNVSDWLNDHYEQPQRSARGALDFNLKWLKEDPVALGKLYLFKFTRSWYISESGRWDRQIFFTHLPFWIFALIGLWRWRQRAPGDPALIFLMSVVIYLWVVSGIAGGVARHNSFIYGFIGMLDGVFFLDLFQRLKPGPGLRKR